MTHSTDSSVQQYLSGFGNEFASEAIAGTLPIGQNSPQRVGNAQIQNQIGSGLTAEVISGTAFTAPRSANRRTWMYRQKPSVVAGRYAPLALPLWTTAGVNPVAQPTPPEPLRWQPLPSQSNSAVNFLTGMTTLMSNGDLAAAAGVGIHITQFSASMQGTAEQGGLKGAHHTAFVNADADMLLIPQSGDLRITTELGVLDLSPCEIACIPRGMVFRVDLAPSSSAACVYVCENYGAAFRLPELGPIGSQGLANARDFLTPTAAFEAAPAVPAATTLIKKFGGHFWQSQQAHSPFNVVAWHGNLVPFKYDTRRFNAMGSVSFDHPDPSIFTVLTSPSDTSGTANCDFVIFPPRWLVAEHTFRPPWYHRNVMSEFMGLVHGQYDAKEKGFVPGGFSLHNQMVPHGPDFEAHQKASSAELKPIKLDLTLAFMLESRYRFAVSDFALHTHAPDADYANCWANL